MDRYNISNPLINAEAYFEGYKKIKLLHIPMSGEPTVLNDEHKTCIDYVFGNESTLSINLNYYCRMMLAETYFYQHQFVNPFATFLYRLHTNTKDFIYGPALLYGSMNYLTKDRSSTYYSVPHEIFEQVSKLLTTVYT
jgi:hypothetical protein